MAQLQISLSELNELVEIGKEDALERLTSLGFPAEDMGGGLIEVEVTPNRPDALSVEGIARVLKCQIESKPAAYPLFHSSVHAAVDPSVLDARPCFGGAVVFGVRLNEAAMRSIMQLQEKLHETLGRKRRKLAIGLHDLECFCPPIKYCAVGKEEVKFVPLEFEGEMTPLEVMQRHPKGIAYSHLVSGKCPMIVDSRGEVLSFPPIINSERTKVRLETKNILIECTGTSDEAVRSAVGIVACALADRGGRIGTITVGGDRYGILQEKKWLLPVDGANRLLGVEFSSGQISSLLEKMGYRVEGGYAYSAGYRTDVMSEVDIIEDIAIAYGFNNFKPTLPRVQTIGCQKDRHPYHSLMLGMGFTEAITWTLSSRQMESKAELPLGERVEIENPLTADFSIFRSSIIPNILMSLAESKGEKLPIRVYEIGPVASPSFRQVLCAASMHPKADFSEIKSVAEALFENCGEEGVWFERSEFGPFISGRCAKVVAEGKELGFLGEISPSVLSAFGLEQPVCALEIALKER